MPPLPTRAAPRTVVLPDGLSVLVRCDGPEDAPPVVFLHGNPDSSTTWAPVLALLRAGSPLRCICPDMPGFGQSPTPPRGFDYLPGSTVPLWDALFDALGVNGPVTLVVHDFGGPWLLPWAARRPDRVAGVVVVDSPYSPAFPWHPFARLWQTPVLGELSALSSPRALFRWEMRRGSKGLPEAYCDTVHAESGVAMRLCVLRTYRAWRDIPRLFGEELPRLLVALRDRPVRVLHGALDPYISADHAEVFGVAPQLVPQVGHWLQVERPDLVAEAVRAVQAEVEAC